MGRLPRHSFEDLVGTRSELKFVVGSRLNDDANICKWYGVGISGIQLRNFLNQNCSSKSQSLFQLPDFPQDTAAPITNDWEASCLLYRYNVP